MPEAGFKPAVWLPMELGPVEHKTVPKLTTKAETIEFIKKLAYLEGIDLNTMCDDNLRVIADIVLDTEDPVE